MCLGVWILKKNQYKESNHFKGDYSPSLSNVLLHPKKHEAIMLSLG